MTAVIPYYGYARQDRKNKPRVPISASVMARLLEASGVDRVIAIDLHSGQIQGFFGANTTCDNLAGGFAGVEYILNKTDIEDFDNCVIVSPDAGGVGRAKIF